MSGYIYNIRLWRLSGPFLEARARDRRRALSMGEIETRLCQIDHFLEAVEHLLDGCPEDLQLDWRRYARDRKGLTTSASVAYESMRSMVDRVSVVEGFVSETPPTFESRPSVRTNLRRQCFLAHQANLYVTQQMLLLMGIIHKQEILATADPISDPALPYLDVYRNHGDFTRDKMAILNNMLQILQSLPIESVAANSLFGLYKIRYVAAELLDYFSLPDDSDMDPSILENAKEGRDYLVTYIGLMTKIESLYSLSATESPHST